MGCVVFFGVDKRFVGSMAKFKDKEEGGLEVFGCADFRFAFEEVGPYVDVVVDDSWRQSEDEEVEECCIFFAEGV